MAAVNGTAMSKKTYDALCEVREIIKEKSLNLSDVRTLAKVLMEDVEAKSATLERETGYYTKDSD